MHSAETKRCDFLLKKKIQRKQASKNKSKEIQTDKL